MIKKVLDVIARYKLIEKGDSIVVGVSGGPDSVCLLHILHTIREKLELNLYTVHINHMLRGDESDEDERYVRNLCLQLDIPFLSKSIDIKSISSNRGISLEEAGRDARYSFFAEVAAEVDAKKIAVAHNKNDQVETVIMRIIRGTGLEGLKGMEFRRGHIIRPLLCSDRKQIEEYCRIQKLNPRTDSSNLTGEYTRNKIRLELLPYINSMFDTDITDNVYKMAGLLKEDNEFIEMSALEVYNRLVDKSTSGKVAINMDSFRALQPSIYKRVIRNAIKDINGSLKGIENVHIESIANLILDGRTGAVLDLPGGLCASRSYTAVNIHFKHAEYENSKYEREIIIPGVTDVPEAEFTIETHIVDRSTVQIQHKGGQAGIFEQHFDYEKLKTGIYIRVRKDGDIFKPLNSNGTKKLKEYFIDNKIPRQNRDIIPLVAQNNEIIWIIGYKISDKFKVSENTKRVLIIKYKKDGG